MLYCICRLVAHHDISLRCAIWSLSGHSGLWPAERPVDLWVHGLLVAPPAAELVVEADGKQLDVAIVRVDKIATKWRWAGTYPKGLVV